MVANVNYALTPYTKEAGALAMVPGSHRLARQPRPEELILSGDKTIPNAVPMELDPGDVAKYTVVRIADEVIVDLMRSASGIDYAEASKDMIIREIEGVPIPFASPRLLWRMKARTHRAKDEADLVFLREYFKARGEEPPEV